MEGGGHIEKSAMKTNPPDRLMESLNQELIETPSEAFGIALLSCRPHTKFSIFTARRRKVAVAAGVPSRSAPVEPAR